MTVPGNIDALLLGGQRGYQTERSLRFNSADSAYLNRTPASAGNRKTWTWSGWVKRSKLGAFQRVHAVFNGSTIDGSIRFNDTDTFQFISFVSSTQTNLVTTQVFRDVSAWYHIVISADTTQATSSDRIKIYLNGTQISTFSTSTYPSSSADLAFNTTTAHYLGQSGASTEYLDGYLTEVHFIDGQALTPSSFGETDTITGVWKPKRYAGTYGTNGFYLKFADNSGTTSTTLGKDSSGNGNNWTPNNFSVTAGAGNDSLIDTPTPYADGGNGRGNYCTLNPLDKLLSPTLVNGNLDATVGDNAEIRGAIYVSSGKWYWEVVPTTMNQSMIGVGVGGATKHWATTGISYYGSNGNKYVNGTPSAYGASYTNNDVIGVALDLDNLQITFYKNNVSQGTITGLTAGSYAPALSAAANSSVYVANFGQRAFAYTPPSGFLALNTQNLPEPSIKKPSSYMDVVLYTGNGSARSITGLGFSPDLVWIKERSGADNHRLVDAVRGATKELYSSLTNAEGTDANGLTAFNSDGFSLGTSNSYNENGVTHVAWCWDESATPGFDIVTYTGTGSATTVAHNLGVAPKMIIAKNRTSASSWDVYHIGLTSANYRVQLNSTGAESVSNGSWNGTAPTSTVFSVKDDTATNSSGASHVAYLWSEVAGFSKFGSYTGNGSSDGPFVFCGFRPAFVMVKNASDTGGRNWGIVDNKRGSYNSNDYHLIPNTAEAENNSNPAGTYAVDFLSNGFKVRNTTGVWNGSSNTIIFAAFAETPAKYSLAR